MSEAISIGRTRELERLGQAIAEAAEGRGGVWLLLGEPGIGKTRLAENAAAIARAAGFRCVWGRCWESGGAPAFWPWVQVARALDGAGVTGPAPPPPALRTASPIDPPSSSEPLSRFELFDRAAAWLLELSRSEPLWIALEDLHAADPESLALLESLAVTLRSAPVLIVATLRDAALETGPLRGACQRIVRQAQVLTLGRLARAEARALLRELDTTDEAWTSRALDATEGHPLFLVELVRLVRLSGPGTVADDLIPASLHSAFRQRLERLSPSCLEVLVRSALLGSDIDHDLLRRSFAPDQVAPALDEAIQHGLVRQLGKTSWRLAHAVLRDVLIGMLDAGAREAAHGEVADLLEAQAATAAELAHHLWRAGEQRRAEARRASARAAEESLRRYAFEDALGHAARSTEGLLPSEDPALRARAHVIEGHALLGLGRREEGLAACLAAAELARVAGSAEGLASAALAYGSVYQFAAVDPTLVQLLEESLALLGPGDSALRAQLLARLAAARQPDPDPARPIALARESLAMAERMGDTEALVASLRAGCSTLVDLAHPAERRALDERHLELALRLGFETDELRARQRLAFDCMELGDFRSARGHVEKATRLASSGSHPRYRWLTHALSALLQLWQGNLNGTEALMASARAEGERAGDSNAELAHLFQRARWIELSGDERDADLVARGLGESMGHALPGRQLSQLAQARFLLELGRVEEGLRAADRAAVDVVLAVGDRTMLYGAARWAAATGDGVVGQRLLDRYGEERDLFVADGVVGLSWRAPLPLVLAHAEEATGAFEAALDSAHTAAVAGLRTGGLPAAAECFGLAARMAERLGRQEEASAHRARALQTIAGCGLEGLERRLRASGPTPTEPAGRRSGSHAVAGEPRPPEFREEGDVVCITWGGRSVRVKATKGVAVLSQLVAQPGVAVHVLDLVHAGQAHPAVDSGDAGELLDPEAIATYRARAEELRADLVDAERNNDLGRSTALRNELEFIATELSRGRGLGGRTRRAPAVEERARQAIRKQIRTTLQHLGQLDPELARYLDRSIRTGRICVFEP